MKHFKSERLKKLESELNDLEQWLKLGLVPKRDIVKHKEEIQQIQGKIEEEKERIQFLKESGEAEEFITPKKSQTRAGYTEMPTIPDIDSPETQAGSYSQTEYNDNQETDFGADTTASDTKGEDDEPTLVEEDEESYFSEKNRWKRGSNIIDPDADEW